MESATQRTTPYRVFVFPSCNEVGLEIIQALAKSNKVQLFGGSSYDLKHDPSRLLLRNHVPCPGHDAPDFEERFRAILAEHAVDLVFPAWDPLVARFAAWDLGPVRCVAPGADTAHVLLSKSATYAALGDCVPVPEIQAGEPDAWPLFGKPDASSGSKGIMRIDTPEDYAAARARGLLITEYLPGEEYTADCFSDLDGVLRVCCPRHRGLIGRGIALGAEAVVAPDIEGYCAAISTRLHLAGPWLAQFKRAADGRLKLLEVNARVAGSMGLTRHAGVNIPLLSVFLFMGHEVRIPRVHRPIVVNRHLNFQAETAGFDWVIWDLDDTLLRKDGKPDPEAVASLYDCRNRGKKQALLSKNSDVFGALRTACLSESLFEAVLPAQDKAAALESLFETHGFRPENAVMVNDSYAETFAIQARFPALRTLTPDALSVLGREPVE